MDNFAVSKNGELIVRLSDENGTQHDVRLPALMKRLSERGTGAPVLLRFRDLLRARGGELIAAMVQMSDP